MPLPGPVKAWHPLINSRICAPFAQYDQDRAAFAFTFAQHAGKAATRLSLANKPGNFEMGGKPGVHAQSLTAAGSAQWLGLRL